MTSFLDKYDANLPGIVYVKDLNSRFLFSSNELAKQAGVATPSKLLDLTDFDMPWAAFGDQYQADDARVMQGETIQQFEPFINHHREHGFLLVTKQPIVNNHEVVGVIGNAQLVTMSLQSRLLALQYNDEKLAGKKNYELKSNYPLLTKRESEILFHLIRFYSAKIIGQKLNISSRTVEKHIEVIKEKFYVKSKNELIEFAIENNLFNVIIKHTDNGYGPLS